MYTQCPKCSEVFEVDAEFAGQRVDCTECGENFEIREAVGQKCPYCGKRAEPEKEGTVVACACGNKWTVGPVKEAQTPPPPKPKKPPRQAPEPPSRTYIRPTYRDFLGSIQWTLPTPDVRLFGERPITARQIEFLADLGMDETEELHLASRKWASDLIGEMLVLREEAMYMKGLRISPGRAWLPEDRDRKCAEVDAQFAAEEKEKKAQEKIAKAKEKGIRVCPKCGKRGGKTAQFCAQCGTPLDPPGDEA